MSLFVMDIVKQQVKAIMVVFFPKLVFIYTDNPIRLVKRFSTLFVTSIVAFRILFDSSTAKCFSWERTSINFSMQGCISIVNKINLLAL